MRCTVCQIRDRQLRFFGHVARFPATDPAHRILHDLVYQRVPDDGEWIRAVGRPRVSWVSQLSNILGGGVGPAQAWSRAKGREAGWRGILKGTAPHYCECSHT